MFGKKKLESKPAPPPISDAKKAQAAKLMAQMNKQMSKQKSAPQTKEDKLREMMEGDPEKAAQLLRELFLKGK